jgi:pimeloyl-ACP methyl ester carboxylesterase
VTPEPSYLAVGEHTMLVTYHPASEPRRDTAVLLWPPFGWEDVCSYRPRRAWANELAEHGYPVVRVDLPGTGDSTGSTDDGELVTAGIDAVATTADWLRVRTGCTRVAAIGIGLGGLYVAEAAVRGTPIADVVLWGVPGRGRSVVRELRAFERLAGHQQRHEGGGIAANGFVLSADGIAALEAIDLHGATAPNVERVLLLERDGLPVDDALRAAFAGADVTTMPGDGYGAMMARPQESVPPVDVIARVTAWLDDVPGASGPGAAIATDEAVSFSVDGTTVRERVLGSAAVLTEPDGDDVGLTAVLLNAGAIRRIGPNRLWVGIARRWAARGVPTVRIDLSSIGDGPGADRWTGDDGQFYGEVYRGEVTTLLDELVVRGLPDRFLLLGLCSGAYWSFNVAQDDPRVVAAVLLNPLTFKYDPFNDVVRTSRVLRRIWQQSGWRRLLAGGSSRANIGRVLRAATARVVSLPKAAVVGRAGHAALVSGLDRLREKAVRTTMVFSNGEPLREEIARSGLFDRTQDWPNLHVHLLDGPVDSHTLQPLELQRRVTDIVDGELDAVLAALDGSS